MAGLPPIWVGPRTERERERERQRDRERQRREERENVCEFHSRHTQPTTQPHNTPASYTTANKSSYFQRLITVGSVGHNLADMVHYGYHSIPRSVL